MESAIKIFICWSGRRGKGGAVSLADWLKDALGDFVTPVVSMGLDKGINWSRGLEQSLQTSNAGLLCLTPEALRSPWVSYEAGFLSRAVTPSCNAAAQPEPARLFTFLWGLRAGDLTGPLATFQSTDGDDPNDVRRLIDALIAAMGANGPDAGWKESFDTRWPELWEQLHDRLALVPAATPTEAYPELPELFRLQTFEEPNPECVDQRWLDRYEAARIALTALRDHNHAIARACRGYAVDLYRALETEVAGYAMALSQLVGRDRFVLDAEGRVDIRPPGLLSACERRRRGSRRLVARLIDPAAAPFFTQAVRFQDAEEFDERKKIVHALTPAVARVAVNVGDRWPTDWPANAFCFELVDVGLRTGRRPPTAEGGRSVDLPRAWCVSDWDLDRIMYGLFLEHRADRAPDSPEVLMASLELAENELERARARAPKTGAANGAEARHESTMMPLYYALRVLKRLERLSAGQRLEPLLDNVIGFLDERGTTDAPVRAVVAEIRRRLNGIGTGVPGVDRPAIATVR